MTSPAPPWCTRSAATIALWGAIILGPRLGRKFKRDGGGPTPPHDLNIAAIGAVILWFGWYGFNPGSTLSAMDYEGIGRVAANTTLAACAGGLVAVFFVYPRSKKWDLGMALNGFLGGLVAITAPCYWVSPDLRRRDRRHRRHPRARSFVDLVEHLRVDDPIGAVAVHMGCGIFGTLAVGLFAAGEYGLPTPTGADNATPVEGLFTGGGADQLVVQLIGSLSCIVVVSHRLDRHLQGDPVAARQLEPPARAGAGARGHRHRRARQHRLPHGVRPGHELRDTCGDQRGQDPGERSVRASEPVTAGDPS